MRHTTFALALAGALGLPCAAQTASTPNFTLEILATSLDGSAPDLDLILPNADSAAVQFTGTASGAPSGNPNRANLLTIINPGDNTSTITALQNFLAAGDTVTVNLTANFPQNPSVTYAFQSVSVVKHKVGSKGDADLSNVSDDHEVIALAFNDIGFPADWADLNNGYQVGHRLPGGTGAADGSYVAPATAAPVSAPPIYTVTFPNWPYQDILSFSGLKVDKDLQQAAAGTLKTSQHSNSASPNGASPTPDCSFTRDWDGDPYLGARVGNGRSNFISISNPNVQNATFYLWSVSVVSWNLDFENNDSVSETAGLTYQALSPIAPPPIPK